MDLDRIKWRLSSYSIHAKHWFKGVSDKMLTLLIGIALSEIYMFMMWVASMQTGINVNILVWIPILIAVVWETYRWRWIFRKK